MLRKRVMRRPDFLLAGTGEAVCVSGDNLHTSPQTRLFYAGAGNSVPRHEWTDDFLMPRPFWVDIIEDFIPVP